MNSTRKFSISKRTKTPYVKSSSVSKSKSSNKKSKKSKSRSKSKTRSKTMTKTKSSSKNEDYVCLIKKIIQPLMEMKHSIKLFHWTTSQYPIHKITDSFLEVLDPLLDKYVEVVLGASKHTMNKNIYVETKLQNILKNISIQPIQSKKSISSLLDSNVKILNTHTNCNTNVELLAIRDEIVSEIQRFKYLLNFSR